MFKFLRGIRQRLVFENKSQKYLRYAMGEIVLVVIGILIALQINVWNELQNQSKKETRLLEKLESEISQDFKRLQASHKAYEKYEANAKKGLDLFYKAKTIKDIDSVYSLTYTSWIDLNINHNTYNEMVNTGSLYSLENDKLQKAIISYYLAVEADKYYIHQVNDGQMTLIHGNKELRPFLFLMSQVYSKQLDLDRIDTSWLNNPNSETYIAVSRYLTTNIQMNLTYRISVYQRNLKRAEILLEMIQEEINNRK